MGLFMRKAASQEHSRTANELHGPSPRDYGPQVVKGWRGLFVAPAGWLLAASTLNKTQSGVPGSGRKRL